MVLCSDYGDIGVVYVSLKFEYFSGRLRPLFTGTFEVFNAACENVTKTALKIIGVDCKGVSGLRVRLRCLKKTTMKLERRFNDGRITRFLGWVATAPFILVKILLLLD